MTASIDATSKLGARALQRLDMELIGWLTTTNPDGQPQSSPIWFLWVEGRILIYSRTRAPRNDNVAERPLVSFHLNSDSVGGDVVTMEGEARVDLTYPPADQVEAYIAKYRALLTEYDWTPEYFASQYTLPILVQPTRWRLE
jgi:PPOX class probable F420-dependent enzyme